MSNDGSPRSVQFRSISKLLNEHIFKVERFCKIPSLSGNTIFLELNFHLTDILFSNRDS